jgi:uncharacterized membrane protein YoaK (UPF0700 family)
VKQEHNQVGFSSSGVRIQLLSVIAASADVTSFLCFHDVFTSAMTGNLALIGIAASQGRLLGSHALLALPAFALGAIFAGAVQGESPRSANRVLALETLFLALYVAMWWTWGFVPPTEAGIDGMILCSALAMGAQSVLSRQIDVAGVPSVVFTNTLTSIVLGAVQASKQKAALSRPTRQQIAALMAYAAGALLFAWLLQASPLLAVNLPLALLMLVWSLARRETTGP